VPISVVWSETRQGYVLNPILTRPARVPLTGVPDSLRSQYENGLLLQRMGRRSAFTAYGTDELIVQRWKAQAREIPVLVGGIRTFNGRSGQSRPFVVGWAFTFERGRPRISPLCYTGDSAVLRVLPPSGDPANTLRSSWDAIGRSDRDARAGIAGSKALRTNTTGECITGE